MGQGKPVLCKGVASSRLTMLYWKTIYPRVYGQHKLDVMSFLKKERGNTELGG